MASDTSSNSTVTKPAITSTELLALVREQLDADEERRAKVSAASAGELPRESQDGSTLDLSHRDVAVLTIEVVQLIKDRVERLALSHNLRISLPTEIGRCDRLRYLNLRWNKLIYFPDAVLNLPKLEILDISKNAIIGLPEDISRMTNLKFLAVAKNQITRLPLALGDMNLIKLKFDENPIEFPPPDALKLSADRVGLASESEKDKELCLVVKRFMKHTQATNAMREQLRTPSQEDLSESNVETPRPPKRSATVGRFPVRPSISGIDHFDLKTDSPPEKPPPIPERSHARQLSAGLIVNPEISRRPGIAPLLTGVNDISRSRSETVSASASVRSRRQGYVPRKVSNLGSAKDKSNRVLSPTSSSSTITPGHSRVSSVASSQNGHAGDISSGAPSPVEGIRSRLTTPRNLESLPESRNSTLPTINSLKAVKRLLFMFSYLGRPIADLAKLLMGSTHDRTTLDRLLYSAVQKGEHVDHLITKAHQTVENNSEIGSAQLADMIRVALQTLKLYSSVAKELRRYRQRTIRTVDAFHVRCTLGAIHNTLVEARNLCFMLGFKIKAIVPNKTPRASQAWNNHTITPVSSKLSSRRRGPTVLTNLNNSTNTRGIVPPVSLNTNGSRSNTITSSTVNTPRSVESFATIANNTLPSRGGTVRNVTVGDGEEHSNDVVYTKVKHFCEIADPTLIQVRNELDFRQANASRAGMSTQAKHYIQGIGKCDFLIIAITKLHDRVRALKIPDMARAQKEPLQIPPSIITEWAKFVEQIRECQRLHIDVGTIKQDIKPIHHALKDANRTCLQAAMYMHNQPLSAGLHGFPANINTNVAHLGNSVPPVPATPAGAALGPAVQATVASTPSASGLAQGEYFGQVPLNRTRSTHERYHGRNDTVMQPPAPPHLASGYSRR